MTYYSRFNSKYTVGQCKKIDLAMLKKRKALDVEKGTFNSVTMQWGTNYNHKINTANILISLGKNPEEKFIHIVTAGHTRVINQRVYLTNTPCNYGGLRYWFICPCQKRVRIIYLSPHPMLDYFGCRHCLNLTYYSRNEPKHPFYRIIKLDQEADKLGKTMRRGYWDGKPTRKHRRILKMDEQIKLLRSALDTKLETRYKRKNKA